jgi:arylsulfatase
MQGERAGEMSHRKNIILISTDQQRADTLACLGHRHMITPNLDRLAGDGVAFSNAFACAATCMSSRCAFYTGHYPNTTGVMGFDAWTGRQNWVHRLRAAGYHCANLGKTHIHGPNHGFHERIADQRNKAQPDFTDATTEPSLWATELRAAGFEPPVDLHQTVPDYDQYLTALPWALPEEWHYDTWMGRKAVEYIERWDPASGPRFLHIGFLGPHEPYDPCQRFVDMYAERDIPMPRFGPAARAGMPDALYASRRSYDAAELNLSSIRTACVNEASVRRMRRHYYANITQIDESIGRILAALKAQGLYENALILFTSDHGDHLLDHDLAYKGDLFDEVIKVPLIVKPAGRGRTAVSHALVSQLDVARYLLEAAGVEADDLSGRTLRPLLDGSATAIRDYVYAQEGSTCLRPEPEVLTMIPSQEWKLVAFPDPAQGLLFHLADDPGETRNLWDDPAAREMRGRLAGELAAWLTRSRWRSRNLYAKAR